MKQLADFWTVLRMKRGEIKINQIRMFDKARIIRKKIATLSVSVMIFKIYFENWVRNSN